MKHPDSVMVWGSFSGTLGHAGLFFLPKNMIMKADYIKVLHDHMLPICHFMKFRDVIIFCRIMHDASCHKAKKVMKWLSDHNVQLIEWPGNSPDLNPIENCWTYMKNLLSTCNTSSVLRLSHKILKMWITEMKLDYFRNLSDSMPERLQLVIKAKGQMTKY